MKVLVVTHKDGPNLFIENVVGKIIEKGHRVDIYAKFTDNQSIRMFKKFNITIKSLKKLTESIVEKYDCILCPSQAITDIAFRNKYIFSVCNMNPHFDHIRGSDFVFTLDDLGEDYNHVFATMPVGNPKNDVTEVVASIKTSNQILVIDTGHFPFSKEGKYQAAQMILDMANGMPDKKVVVKPRWMPGVDVSAMTHVNKYHIYDIIEELTDKKLPSNLTLLREHLNLQELIDQSEIVVTLCTTAFLDVALRGKPLIIASGFENEDTFHLRADYFNRVYKYAEGSGCVVDYNHVLDYLPQGINCNESFLREAFYANKGASDRIVDVMEYVTETLLKNDKIPLVQKYDYSDYKKVMETNNIPLEMDSLIADRMYNMAESVVALNHSISINIDWRDFIETQKKLCGLATPNKKGYSLLYDDLMIEKMKYIIVHKADLLGNDIDLGYYYEALYNSKQYEDFYQSYVNLDFHPVLNYYGAMYYSLIENYDKSNECLVRYFEDYSTREFVKYKTDTLTMFWNACRCMFNNCNKQKKTLYGIKKILFYVRNSIELRTRCKCVKSFIIKIINKCFRKIKKLIGKKFRVLKGRLKSIYIIFRSQLGFLNNEQTQVLKFKDKYKGRRAVIIGNGPSLKKEDLEKFQHLGYICFASNKIYKIFEETLWRPDVYACFDSLVYNQNCEELLSNVDCDIFLNSNFKINKNMKKKIYLVDYLFFKSIIRFCSDCRYVYSGGSVTFVLISLAYMMGIRDFYVIGCDHNYGIFDKKEKQKFIEVDDEANQDYFTSNYMKKGEKMNVGNLKRAEKGYRVARKYIEKHGGHIYNATRGGKLEVFERVDVDELLSEGAN